MGRDGSQNSGSGAGIGRAPSRTARGGVGCETSDGGLRRTAAGPAARGGFVRALGGAGSQGGQVISFSNIHKQYGKQLIFVDASFQLNPGEKVGLVGPNGAGKTTLFRMVVGEDAPDEGEVSVPKKLTIGYFRQDVEEMKGRSVLDEAIAGSGPLGDLHHELADLHHAMGDPGQADDMDRILARFGEVQEKYEHLGGYALEAQAREVLHGLGFQDDQIECNVGALSGGWKMRVALARVLIGRPDVLLMDEPTNHLDIESIIWLEQL